MNFMIVEICWTPYFWVGAKNKSSVITPYRFLWQALLVTCILLTRVNFFIVQQSFVTINYYYYYGLNLQMLYYNHSIHFCWSCQDTFKLWPLPLGSFPLLSPNTKLENDKIYNENHCIIYIFCSLCITAYQILCRSWLYGIVLTPIKQEITKHLENRLDLDP